jgi:hypothetical protein
MPVTPVAPSASVQAALGQWPSPSAGTNGIPFVSSLSPLTGATPAARQSRFRGVHLGATLRVDPEPTP